MAVSREKPRQMKKCRRTLSVNMRDGEVVGCSIVLTEARAKTKVPVAWTTWDLHLHVELGSAGLPGAEQSC